MTVRTSMALYNKINGRRIDLLVCDGDRTLIDFKGSEYGSSWDLVGHLYCLPDEWQRTARMYVCRINQATTPQDQEAIFREWICYDLMLLKGNDATPAQQADIPYNKGVTEYFSGGIDGTRTAIVSAGLDIIFERARKELGIDVCITNRIGIDRQGRFDGTIKLDVTLHNKQRHLIELMGALGIQSAGQVMAVGDSHGDIALLETVKLAGGLAIAINPTSDEVAKVADAVVQDFFELDMYAEKR
jgi:HAD superfamily phosphoserine phosphatase-like hydrolase